MNQEWGARIQLLGVCWISYTSIFDAVECAGRRWWGRASLTWLALSALPNSHGSFIDPTLMMTPSLNPGALVKRCVPQCSQNSRVASCSISLGKALNRAFYKGKSIKWHAHNQDVCAASNILAFEPIAFCSHHGIAAGFIADRPTVTSTLDFHNPTPMVWVWLFG